MKQTKTPKNNTTQNNDVSLIEIISCLGKDMMKVGSKANLINYPQLREIFRKKFKATDSEINFWISNANRKDLCPLHGEVRFEYAQCYEKNNSLNYIAAFFYKAQVQNFEPKIRLMTCEEVRNFLKQSTKGYAIDDEDVTQLLMNELCLEDFHKFWRATDSKIFPPMIDGKSGVFYESKKGLTAEQLRKAVEGALFDKTHVIAIREQYFSSESNDNVNNAKQIKAGKSKNKLAKNRITKAVIDFGGRLIKFKKNGALNQKDSAIAILKYLNDEKEEGLVSKQEIVEAVTIAEYLGLLSDGKELYPDQAKEKINLAKNKLNKSPS